MTSRVRRRCRALVDAVPCGKVTEQEDETYFLAVCQDCQKKGKRRGLTCLAPGGVLIGLHPKTRWRVIS